MSNPRNNGTFVGNLAAAPKIFANADGSRTVQLTAYAEDDFRTKGEYLSQGIPFEAFLSARNDSNGLYGTLVAGSTVAISYSLRQNNYTDKNGVRHYGTVQRIESIAPIGPRKQGATAVVENAGSGNSAPAAASSAQPVQAPAQAPQVSADEETMTAPVS